MIKIRFQNDLEIDKMSYFKELNTHFYNYNKYKLIFNYNSET